MKYFRYLRYILKHKWFVMVECFKHRLYWQGITHDLSKFLLDEFIPYANYFWGDKLNDREKAKYIKPTTTSDKTFDFAWLLHLKRNKHHWQWWILPEDSGGIKILPMPNKYLEEMLCDWTGAGRVQGRNFSDIEWYQRNKNQMQLNPKTQKEVVCRLERRKVKR